MTAADSSVPGQPPLPVLRSPHPHARIAPIDATAAAAMPGVVAILTGEDLVRAGVRPLVSSVDFKRADGSPTAAPPHHALAGGTGRYLGEAGAVLLARQSAKGVEIAEHEARLMKGADQILPGLQVHAHFAANGAVHLGEERGRHLHERHAPQISRGDKPRQIAHHAAAERDNK